MNAQQVTNAARALLSSGLFEAGWNVLAVDEG